jgi:hypothetical protein
MVIKRLKEEPELASCQIETPSIMPNPNISEKNVNRCDFIRPWRFSFLDFSIFSQIMSSASGAGKHLIKRFLNFCTLLLFLKKTYFNLTWLKWSSTAIACSSLSKETIADPQTNLKVLSS